MELGLFSLCHSAYDVGYGILSKAVTNPQRDRDADGYFDLKLRVGLLHKSLTQQHSILSRNSELRAYGFGRGLVGACIIYLSRDLLLHIFIMLKFYLIRNFYTTFSKHLKRTHQAHQTIEPHTSRSDTSLDTDANDGFVLILQRGRLYAHGNGIYSSESLQGE